MTEQEVTPQRNPADYLKIFFRRKWFILIPAYVGLIGGIVAGLLLPPKYESSTIILVEEEKMINPLIQGLAVSTSAAQRMQNIRERILSWNSLLEITKKLNLAKNIQNQLQFETLILNLRKDIEVKLRGQNIVQIAYSSQNPKEAQLVAQTITDVLVEENMRSQAKETDVAINFIKEQLDVYKRKIKESEIADLDNQLKSLLVDSTDAHPLVKELRQKIAIANKELETGKFEVKPSGAVSQAPMYESLKQELDKIINKGESPTTGPMSYAFNDADSNKGSRDPNTTIFKLMLLDKIEGAQARDIKVNENIYTLLLQKLETAKITQRLEVSKEGTRYTVIDPARLPLKPSKPNKAMVMLLGLFAGACAGVGLVFAREFLDQSFIDIDDAKNTLTLPVLGAISRLTTQEEITKKKSKGRKVAIIGTGFSIALVVCAVLFSFFRH